jgi:hypothetical protein
MPPPDGPVKRCRIAIVKFSGPKNSAGYGPAFSGKAVQAFIKEDARQDQKDENYETEL